VTRLPFSVFRTRSRRPGIWIDLGVLSLILAMAAFLRFAWLDTIPPGMTHDEAAFGAEAEIILDGAWPVYFTLGYGHEPFYSYLVAAAFAMFGHTLGVMRAVAAGFGLLLVPLTYYFARRRFGFHVAWIGTAWLAVAFWPINMSRQALRGNMLAPLWLLAAILFWEALEQAGYGAQRQTGAENGPQSTTGNRQPVTFFILSGFFLGLTFYTYLSARVTWAVFPALIVYMLCFKAQRAVLRKIWPGLLAMSIVTLLVALPLGLYLLRNPGDQVRLTGMMEPINEFLAGRPQRLLGHLWNGLRVFSWIGDTFWAYNIAGRPIFDLFGSLALYAGILIALRRWRDPRYAFLLLWLGAAMFPGLVTTNEGIFLRILTAQPVVYILAALAVVALRDRLVKPGFNIKHRNRLRAAWLVLAISLIFNEGLRSFHDHFVDWPNRRETRTIYNQTIVAASRHLRDDPQSGVVAFSTLYPLYYHDPWLFRYVAARPDLSDRWFDGRGCLLYPHEGKARFILTALTPLDAALRTDFEADATMLARYQLRSDDENPYLEVWNWQDDGSLAAQLTTLQADSPLWISPETQFNRPDLRQTLDNGATFGDVMTLLAYQFNQTTFNPGDQVELITWWRALRTVHEQDDWDTFVHLLDHNGQMLGSTDVLDCPPTGWQPADLFVQVHRFRIGEAEPGKAFVEVGVYRHQTGRVPVMVQGQAVADRVLLKTIQVKER